MSITARSLVAVLITFTAAGARADLGDHYPLDELAREIPDGKPTCGTVEMERYGGTLIPYQKATLVYPAFAERLLGLETLVRDTAIEVYGRAPRRLRHDGTYNCRLVRGYKTLLSEHALGNAIDVEGFDFGPAPRGSDAPRGLRGAFSVSLGRDWNATHGARALHAHFLRLLAQRVIDRPDLFRVVLGPSYPGHTGHFHFDLAPYRLVHVFGYDPSDHWSSAAVTAARSAAAGGSPTAAGTL